jgi:hypothetical protein
MPLLIQTRRQVVKRFVIRFAGRCLVLFTSVNRLPSTWESPFFWTHPGPLSEVWRTIRLQALFYVGFCPYRKPEHKHITRWSYFDDMIWSLISMLAVCTAEKGMSR